MLIPNFMQTIMNITVNRQIYTCWQPVFEVHFGWHFIDEEIKPVEYLIDIDDGGKSETTFYVLDWDGSQKNLVIDKTDRADASDSWQTGLG